MRSFYALEQTEEALTYANLVIEDPQTPQDILRTAIYWRGKIALDRNDEETARLDLVSVASYGGERGAECQYLLCRIQYDQQRFSETETLIFQLIDQFAAYDEWKFKGFLLLVDTYIGMEDWFQARTTAQSILENVPLDWVQTQALAQMKELNRLEQRRLLEDSVKDSLEAITPDDQESKNRSLRSDSLNTDKQ